MYSEGGILLEVQEVDQTSKMKQLPSRDFDTKKTNVVNDIQDEGQAYKCANN